MIDDTPGDTPRDMPGPDAVRLRVGLRTEGGGAMVEWLWASPVEVHETGGTFELRNHAFHTRLAAGDRVRARLDPTGALHVVDVERPAPAIMTLVGRVWDTGLQIDAVLERWASRGARFTEGRAGALATLWDEGMSPETVLEVMSPELDAGTLELLEIVPPELRTREALEGDVDFEGLRAPYDD